MRTHSKGPRPVCWSASAPHAATTDVPTRVPVRFSRHSMSRSSVAPSRTSLRPRPRRSDGGASGCYQRCHVTRSSWGAQREPLIPAQLVSQYALWRGLHLARSQRYHQQRCAPSSERLLALDESRAPTFTLRGPPRISTATRSNSHAGEQAVTKWSRHGLTSTGYVRTFYKALHKVGLPDHPVLLVLA